MKATKLKKWGNSTGVIIPRAVLGNMGWKLGDELCFSTKGNKLELQKKTQARTTRESVSIEKLFETWKGEYTPPSDLASAGGEVLWGEPVGDEV